MQKRKLRLVYCGYSTVILLSSAYVDCIPAHVASTNILYSRSPTYGSVHPGLAAYALSYSVQNSQTQSLLTLTFTLFQKC